MKKLYIVSIVASMALVGCGSSSSSSDVAAAPTGSLTTISGTVPGTLIEVFCQDGTYSRVTSNDNGTAEHPFVITVPQGVNCKLVMTTNENDPANRVITPIGFINGGQSGTSIALNSSVNLGHVPLAMSHAEISDADNDHVSDDPYFVTLEGSTAVAVSTVAVMDTDGDGIVDAYEDDDNDNIVNAYEDDDHDGTPNLYDDDNGDTRPDYMEDDDNDGTPNYRDDENHDDKPDYVEDNGQDSNDNQDDGGSNDNNDNQDDGGSNDNDGNDSEDSNDNDH